jgi:antitoxin component YwqK of YwqJK toxin-antitoxin module
MFKSIYIQLISGLFILTSCHPKQVPAEQKAEKKDSIVTVNVNTVNQVPMNEEGLNIDYYNNGKERMKGAIKEGKREGLWQAWYENGNLWSEAEYVKGVNHGKSVTYFENGKIRYEGLFENGSKKGEWKYYDESGKLVKTITN